MPKKRVVMDTFGLMGCFWLTKGSYDVLTLVSVLIPVTSNTTHKKIQRSIHSAPICHLYRPSWQLTQHPRPLPLPHSPLSQQTRRKEHPFHCNRMHQNRYTIRVPTIAILREEHEFMHVFACMQTMVGLNPCWSAIASILLR
jgi:hypothetical protein